MLEDTSNSDCTNFMIMFILYTVVKGRVVRVVVSRLGLEVPVFDLDHDEPLSVRDTLHHIPSTGCSAQNLAVPLPCLTVLDRTRSISDRAPSLYFELVES